MTKEKVGTLQVTVLYKLKVLCVTFVLSLEMGTVAEKNQESVTVNSESFMEIWTNKFSGIDSKLNSLLSANDAKNSPSNMYDPKTENQICSLSARVIELENEVDALKAMSSFKFSKSSSDVTGKSFWPLSSLGSTHVSLQKLVESQETRIVELENRFEYLQNHKEPLPVEDEVETESRLCNISSLGTTHLGQKSLLHHLQNVDFNIFLRKPSNASSLHPGNYKIMYGVDGDKSTWYASNAETNPWFFVDLGVPYFVWEITLVIRELDRAGGTKIYLANSIPMDFYGQPDLKLLPQFASKTGDAVSLTLVFTNPGGICGRYVVVMREIHKEHLIFSELQGVGYALK